MVMLVGLVAAIVISVLRARMRKARRQEVVLPGDEEEGLIKQTGDTDPGDEDTGGNTEGGGGKGMPTAKHRQGGRRPPKLLASVETLDDEDEDEGKTSPTFYINTFMTVLINYC